jgi:hypothetical protein
MGAPKNRFDGVPLVALAAREGKEVIYATHNLCDETTWYGESERVTDKSLTPDGTNTVWSSGDPNWIGMKRGKVFDERALVQDQIDENPSDPHGYGVVVTVDGVEQVQREPFAADGGDYTVDYAAGSVTSTTPGAWAGKSVVASYSKKSGDGWILRPIEGRVLVIERAEVQFSDDIQMASAVVMEIYGLADFFAPDLVTGGLIPAGTPIPIETTIYDSVDQMIDEAIGAHPVIPALSSLTERGYQRPRYIFEFHYAAARTIFSSLGMFLRMSVATKYGGERATATFYAVSSRDPGVEKAIEVLTTVQ